MNKILQIERVGLLKKYVANYSNTTVGALLPSFCTIENALTEKDYEEIYNTLSEQIRQTNYGQNIFEKFNGKTE